MLVPLCREEPQKRLVLAPFLPSFPCAVMHKVHRVFSVFPGLARCIQASWPRRQCNRKLPANSMANQRRAKDMNKTRCICLSSSSSSSNKAHHTIPVAPLPIITRQRISGRLTMHAATKPVRGLTPRTPTSHKKLITLPISIILQLRLDPPICKV